jgi:hypothetical protein
MAYNQMALVNTKQLKFLNEQSIKKEFNRAISKEGIARLDRYAKHVLSLVLPYHKNYAGKVSMRVAVHTRLVGEDDSSDIALLDITQSHWEQVCEKSKHLVRQPPSGCGIPVPPPPSNAPSYDPPPPPSNAPSTD